MPPAIIPQSTAAVGAADDGSQNRHSSVGKKSRNLFGRNCAFADDSPAFAFVRQVDNGGRDIARGSPAIHVNADAALKLVAHLLGAGTLASPAEIGRCVRNSNRYGRHY